jgi:DNA mismatch endonuclease (patch repair protein)
MADPLTPEARSAHMARIRGRDTGPELLLRKLLFAMGYRFRLHRKDLPGRPDIVFKGRRKVVFVHGCFWHQHPGCGVAHVPKTRPDYWRDKFARNRERDARNEERLREAGYDCFVVWECEVRDERLPGKLREFLGPATAKQGRS